jgi:hypothetical protein
VWQEKEKSDGENTECEEDDNDVYYDDENSTLLSILRDMYHLFKEDDTDEESLKKKIFHTKYPKKFRASLRSAQLF